MEHGESVEMRLLRWAQPVEVLRSRYTTFEFPTHAHPEYTIGEVLQGSELFAHRGRQVEAPQGWFLHLNPTVAHTGRAADGSWSYVSLYPSVELLRLLLPELCRSGDPEFPAPVSYHPAMQGRLARFVGAVFQGADDLTLQSELLEILRVLLPPEPKPAAAQAGRSPRSALVARVRDRLNEDWAENVSLLDLAGAMSLTPLTLLRAFRDEVGCTPQTFRTARRLEVARGLIRQGGDLAAIALQCGFSDQSHLTNTFRRWTGLTPGQYRLHSLG